jgi:hypothetical protein
MGSSWRADDAEDRFRDMTYTPGPWVLRASWAKGWFIEALPIPPVENDSTSRGKAVAYLSDWVMREDARLMAAAPELLEALQECAADLAELAAVFAAKGNDTTDETAHLTMADAAIVKAQGETEKGSGNYKVPARIQLNSGNGPLANAEDESEGDDEGDLASPPAGGVS